MNRFAMLFLPGCCALAFAASVSAQGAPACADGQHSPDCKPLPPKPARSPEEIQKSMDAAVGSMAPMMAKMAEATIDAQLKLAALPETAERVAAFKKNLYDQLQKKGFTPAQALQLTLGTPIPAAYSGK